MSKISLPHAFDRWYKLMDAESKRLQEEVKHRTPLLSWEALDHICGLAVESGMKALMLQSGLEKPDKHGDFPADSNGRRPHVDALWDIFIAKASGRKSNDWIKTLSGGKGTPVNAFLAWRAEHRYAADGTVTVSDVEGRVKVARRLKSIAQEEGI